MSAYRSVKIDLGSIPRRTGVKIRIDVDGRTGAQTTILHYHCLDCHFHTNLVEEAFEHQKNAPVWHKVKSRFKQTAVNLNFWTALNIGMALFLLAEPFLFNSSAFATILGVSMGTLVLAFNTWLFSKRRKEDEKIRDLRNKAAGLTP